MADDKTETATHSEEPERIPEDVRKNPWFRAALALSFCWCAFITYGSVHDWITPGHRWYVSSSESFVALVSWMAWLAAAMGLVWKS